MIICLLVACYSVLLSSLNRDSSLSNINIHLESIRNKAMKAFKGLSSVIWKQFYLSKLGKHNYQKLQEEAKKLEILFSK